MKKEAGISLVEVLVTLAVAVMMIVAIVSVILVSLKNSQFAQNQSTATRYAQEAIDQIRSIRDRDGGITNNSAASIVGTRAGCNGISNITKFSDLYCSDLGSSGYFLKLDNLETTPTLGLFNLASFGKEDLGRGLTREIMIKDEESTAGKEKKVIVRVSWEDSSGIHESNLETILVNTR